MKTKILDYKKTISFLLGSFMSLALPPSYILFFAIVGFTGILLLLQNADSRKKSFALGYWFGFGFFAFGFSWVGNALLVDIKSTGWLYPICFLASGAFFGIFLAFPALISSYFKNIYAKFFALSGTIVIFEWIRAFFLTGFPWNMFGSMLAFNNDLIQPAAYIGTYGLSLFVIMLCSSWAIPIFIKSKKSILFPLLVSLIIISAIQIMAKQNLSVCPLEYTDTKIRIVQPAISQELKWNKESLQNNFYKHIELSQSAGLEDIDFVIWGETATPYALDYDSFRMSEIKQAIPKDGYLITGLVRYEFDPYGNYYPLNSMFVINSDGVIEDYYDKSHLVPFGEYIPLSEYLPNFIRPITNIIGQFKAGNGPKSINIGNHPSFGGLICYEIIFPHQVVNQDNRPNWLINVTNDGWYGDSTGPRQHLVTTQLRAIEEALPIIRVANTGISASISGTGYILDKIELDKTGILDIKLSKKCNNTTYYSLFGNIIPLSLAMLNIFIAWLLIISNFLNFKDKE